MIDKKTIILGLVIIAVLVGIVWYNNQNGQIIDNQTASIVEKSINEEQSVSEEYPTGSLVDDFVLGNPEAPVTIIEYSSHLCGHCVDFHLLTLPLIIDKYVKSGQVKVINRIVSPPTLGLAVLCAGEQEKFWQFDEYLFEHIQEIESIDELMAIVSILDLDQDKFNQCFDSAKYEEKIKEWFDKFEEDGFQGTPSFLINNQQIIGNRLYSQFERIIEEELAK